MNGQKREIHIVLISIHGLIRGSNLELGRDADTGGQSKYVLELAMALGACPEISRVDLLTRRVVDPEVNDDYANPLEPLGNGVQIVRLDAGPEEYIRKEELWESLDTFADNALNYFRELKLVPNIIHSHFADAGYIGVRLANQLGLPLVHTGHSLGRVKRRRLLATGLKLAQIEERYNISQRIQAEEDTLGSAELVITSTSQEIEEQYDLYDHYQPEQMRVIPPGTDLEYFQPPDGSENQSRIASELKRFLREPEKPVILALSRPDERKNLATLVEAYGESETLQEMANLVIVAGNRDDIHDMDSGAQNVLTELLLLFDQYNLYGRVAYPKHHQPDEVPVLYRLTAASHGVLINPALTEPFGLTLIEAAASGLPIVATEDGGPTDIIGNCKNGYLIDPLDIEAIAATLIQVLKDRKAWHRLAENGLKGVRKHYSWPAHAKEYLDQLRPILERGGAPPKAVMGRRPMRYHDRAIFSDLDQNLLGDPDSLTDFSHIIRAQRKSATFGIATGRRLDSALRIIKRYHIPQPDVLITSLGTEIHYAPNLTTNTAWRKHIDHLWTPQIVRRTLAELPGIKLQPKGEQSRFKISYFIDLGQAPSVDVITSMLHQEDQTVNVSLSFGQYLDITPVRASKGFALRYFANQWDISLDHVLAAGGSGADEDMMRGNTLAVVVGNRHEEELSSLDEIENIYFAEKPYARGILEAIDHYDFFHECRVPE
jgi:sucrose-phosphate synthase